MKPIDLIKKIFHASNILATATELFIDGEQVLSEEITAPTASPSYIDERARVKMTYDGKNWIQDNKPRAMSFRRPPNDDTPLLGFNTRLQSWIPTRGIILNAQHDQLRNDEFRKKVYADILMTGTGYHVSHWIYAPGGPE
jgi:hypothetical protein